MPVPYSLSRGNRMRKIEVLVKSAMNRVHKKPLKTSAKSKKNQAQKADQVPRQESQKPIPKTSPVYLASVKKPDLNPQFLSTLNVQKEADRVFLSKYAPAGVVINETSEILQFRGDTSDYLRQAPGAPSRNLFKMAREGLLTELRTALAKVMKEGFSFKKENIRIKTSRSFKKISIEIIPLKVSGSQQRHFLILFTDPPALFPVPTAGKTRGKSQSKPGSREHCAHWR